MQLQLKRASTGSVWEQEPRATFERREKEVRGEWRKLHASHEMLTPAMKTQEKESTESDAGI